MIDDKDIDRLSEIFVRKDECHDYSKSVSEKFSNDNARLAVIEQQQKVNNWLSLTIAAGVVALVIKVFLGG